MDLLEGPEARQRAQSIASVITSTMEGRWAWQSRSDVEKKAGIYLSFCCGLLFRARRVETEVPPMLVHFCKNLSHLGMLSDMAEVQESGQPDSNGSICGLNYHHLHCTKHTVYGHGALSNVWQLQQNAVCGQCGEWAVECPDKIFPFFSERMPSL